MKNLIKQESKVRADLAKLHKEYKIKKEQLEEKHRLIINKIHRLN